MARFTFSLKSIFLLTALCAVIAWILAQLVGLDWTAEYGPLFALGLVGFAVGLPTFAAVFAVWFPVALYLMVEEPNPGQRARLRLFALLALLLGGVALMFPYLAFGAFLCVGVWLAIAAMLVSLVRTLRPGGRVRPQGTPNDTTSDRLAG